MQSLLDPTDKQDTLTPRIARTRLQLLLARGNFSTLAGIPLAILMAYVVDQHIAALWVGAWLAVKLSVSALRVVLSWVRGGFGDSASPDAAITRFAALAALDGLVWGCSALWLLHALPGDLPGLLIACLVGAAAAGVFVLYTSLRASLGFAVPVLVPAMVVAMWPDSPLGWYVAPGLAIYLLVLVTEARRMRAQLMATLRLRLNLEVVARDRQTAQDAALNLSHVRDQFVTTLSEQMRSPVSGIVGIARILMRRPAFAADVDMSRLRLMEHAGEHVMRLIDDVLDYSRFSSGDTPLAQEPFDLALVIDEVTQLAAVDAMERNIAFELTPGGALFSGTPYMVVGDAVRVRQVLDHLVSHVLRSISAGEVTLTAVHDRSNGLLDLGVSSHGVETPGVAALTLKVLRDTDRDDAVSGVLGLGLSRRYARAMNGDVLAHRSNAAVLTLLLQLELPTA
jgi:two-component system, sensor histidine kinase